MARVRIFSSDVARSKSFYVDALGFEPVEDWGPAISILRLGDLEIWISGPVSSAAQPWEDGTVPQPGGYGRIVVDLVDEAAQVAAVEAAGGRRVNGPLTGPGGTQLIVTDPDGNSIELFRGR